jgi:hypothetical protein
MTNNEILNYLLKDNFIEEICSNITKNSKYKEDLFQEICLIILEYDNEKLNNAYNEKWVRYLIINIIKNQYNSSTSPFYKKFKKFNYEFKDNGIELSNETNEAFDNQMNKVYKSYIEIGNNDKLSDDIHNNIELIEDILDEAFWYDKEIFKMYFKLGDYNIIDGKKRDEGCKKKGKTSLRRIEKLTGIDHNSIGYTINSTIKFIKKRLEEINKI